MVTSDMYILDKLPVDTDKWPDKWDGVFIYTLSELHIRKKENI